MLYQNGHLEILAINWNKTKSRNILRGDRISWTGLWTGNSQEEGFGNWAAETNKEKRLVSTTNRDQEFRSGKAGGGRWKESGRVIITHQSLLTSGISGDWTWWGSDQDTTTTNYSRVRPLQISKVKTNWTRHEILWRFEDYWQDAFNKRLNYRQLSSEHP